MKKDKVVKLKVKAIDDVGNKFQVTLERGEQGIVLSIEKTPGRWYMSSLLNLEALPNRGAGGARLELPNELAIDFGAKWYCVNMKSVMKAALKRICEGGL